MNYQALVNDQRQKFDLNPNQKTVVFIDFNNLLMRVYNAAKSKNLHPVTPLLTAAYSIKSNIDHNMMFAIADGETSKDSRLEIYPEYKATRAEKTDEERAEIQALKEAAIDLMGALGITYYETNYIEADDAIAIFSKKSINSKWNVITVTSDKDYKQLCNMPNFNLYNQMQSTITNLNNMEKLNGLTAQQYLDYLVLTGDKSDNIKGVSMVGDVTAKKWLKEFGSLSNIMISLMRENKIEWKDYYGEHYQRTMYSEDLFSIGDLANSPIKEGELVLKESTAKKNLIKAIKDGVIDLNYQLVCFQYHHSDKANIDKNTILKPEINIDKLCDFCVEYGQRNFFNKYLSYYFPNGFPTENNEQNTRKLNSPKMK